MDPLRVECHLPISMCSFVGSATPSTTLPFACNTALVVRLTHARLQSSFWWITGYGVVPVSLARPSRRAWPVRQIRLARALEIRCNLPVPGLLRIKNEAAGRRRGTAAPSRRRLLPAAKERQQKGRSLRYMLTPARWFQRKAWWRTGDDSAALVLLWGRPATDAAHASRHTWRASEARKASIDWAAKISLRPQLWEISDPLAVVYLFFVFCCHHVAAPRHGPASGRPE